MSDLSEVLNNGGVELFRELLRWYPTANPEDYYKNGAWRDQIMKLDLQIVVAHRREGGAPEPGDVEELPNAEEIMAKLKAAASPAALTVPTLVRLPGATGAAAPITLAGAATATKIVVPKLSGIPIVAPKLSGAIILPTRKDDEPGVIPRPTVPKVVVPKAALGKNIAAPKVALKVPPAKLGSPEAPVAEFKLITNFVEKWKLDPARAKMALAKITLARRRYVMENFKTISSGLQANAALEAFIGKCERNGEWDLATAEAGGAPKPSTAPKVINLAAQAGQPAKLATGVAATRSVPSSVPSRAVPDTDGNDGGVGHKRLWSGIIARREEQEENKRARLGASPSSAIARPSDSVSGGRVWGSATDHLGSASDGFGDGVGPSSVPRVWGSGGGRAGEARPGNAAASRLRSSEVSRAPAPRGTAGGSSSWAWGSALRREQEEDNGGSIAAGGGSTGRWELQPGGLIGSFLK